MLAQANLFCSLGTDSCPQHQLSTNILAPGVTKNSPSVEASSMELPLFCLALRCCWCPPFRLCLNKFGSSMVGCNVKHTDSNRAKGGSSLNLKCVVLVGTILTVRIIVVVHKMLVAFSTVINACVCSCDDTACHLGDPTLACFIHPKP